MPLRRADDKLWVLGTSLSASGNAVAIPGGEYMFMVSGTPGGATVSLQFQMPDGTWTSVQVYTGSIVQFTTLPANQTAIDLPAGNVRVGMSGGTPSGIFAWLVGLG